MTTTKLPEPVIIPGIMQTIREIRDAVSLEIQDMTYEQERAYLDHSLRNERILTSDASYAKSRFTPADEQAMGVLPV
jgi:hypothetical protein